MSPSTFHAALTPKFVASALGLAYATGKPLSPQPFSSITTDSRKIQSGCLFVALKGDRVDGHEFIAAAVDAGAAGVLCRRGSEVPIRPGLHVFQVEDTLEAYRQL